MDEDTQDIIDKIESGKLVFSAHENKIGYRSYYTAETPAGPMTVEAQPTGCGCWAYDVWVGAECLYVDGEAIYGMLRRLELRNELDPRVRWQKGHDSAMAAIRSL